MDHAGAVISTTAVAPVSADDFESVYADAHGDAARLPWPSRRASPAVVNWLNAMAPSLVRCGARVAVPACGLGHDAREVLRRGYEVVAFDVSPTAIRWARELDPDHAAGYVQADLFKVPARWIRRFDLVVDGNNLQSFPAERRTEVLGALAALLAPHGHLLVVCAAVPEEGALDDGPPWPLTERRLREAAASARLALVGPPACFSDDEGRLRLRAVFRRA